jgi:hypothetical protein
MQGVHVGPVDEGAFVRDWKLAQLLPCAHLISGISCCVKEPCCFRQLSINCRDCSRTRMFEFTYGAVVPLRHQEECEVERYGASGQEAHQENHCEHFLKLSKWNGFHNLGDSDLILVEPNAISATNKALSLLLLLISIH